MTLARPIPATNSIQLFIHCTRCLKEKPDGYSPRDWADNEVGFTPLGIQVWCKRHEINVVHIDFEGHKHPANQHPTEEAHERLPRGRR